MIAFNLPGGVPVFVFALFLGFGAAIGLAWVLWQDTGKRESATLEGGFWLLFGCLVGARAGFVVVNRAYFQVHWPEIWQVQLGGLAWAGAVGGGLAALVIFAKLRHYPAGSLADALLPLGTALVISAWLGCWLDGCAYGASTTGWWGIPAMDEWGGISPRFPLQLLAAGSMLASHGFIEMQIARLKPPGKAAALWLTAFSLQMLIFSTLRADPAPYWLDVRLETWAAGVFLAFSLVGLGTMMRRS